MARGRRVRVLPRAALAAAWVSLALVFCPCGAPGAGAQSPSGGGYATTDPDWRFTLHQRRVKVVLLAGSIGAFQQEPYARHLHQWCGNAEIRNLSRVGYGAWQLYEHLRSQVLENPRLPIGAQGVELWMIWNGGLNSAATGQRSNHYIRRAFRDAHRRGIRVVGLSLSPWGSLEDTRRWGGAAALETQRNTRRIVDFVMGRVSPAAALGPFAEHRETPADGPWRPEEQADVRVDLYDSPLRDRDAPVRDVTAMRALLTRDGRWMRTVEGLDPAAREARLAADAGTLAELPRWFLRREFRGFDAVHPNQAGHRAIAEMVCPRLPASWGCQCPSATTAPTSAR